MVSLCEIMIDPHRGSSHLGHIDFVTRYLDRIEAFFARAGIRGRSRRMRAPCAGCWDAHLRASAQEHALLGRFTRPKGMRIPVVRARLRTLGLCAFASALRAPASTTAARSRPLSMRTTFSASEFPASWPYTDEDFTRMDESPDFNFYSAPRFVTHIDDGAIAALTQYYKQTLKPGADLCDVCSSWISHLPKDIKYGRVVGVGMNARELEANTQLTEWVQADLNREPKLPFDDASFDNILCVVSIDYLIRPREVVSEFHRVLRPGGRVLLSFSNRCFPTKVAQKWLSLNDDGRQRMVGSYFMYSPQVEMVGKPAWVDVGTEKLPAAKRTPVASELGGKLGSLFGSSAAIMAAALGNLGDPMYVVSATKA